VMVVSRPYRNAEEKTAMQMNTHWTFVYGFAGEVTAALLAGSSVGGIAGEVLLAVAFVAVSVFSEGSIVCDVAGSDVD
jgi:hypothetical protein